MQTISETLYCKVVAGRIYGQTNAYLNPASVEFAEDARRQGRRRTTVLQVLANTADSVKSALP